MSYLAGFKVWYVGGTTYSNSDGPIESAPTTGVLIVSVFRHGNPALGTGERRNRIYRDHMFGVDDYPIPYTNVILHGQWASDAEWRATFAAHRRMQTRIIDDIELGRNIP